ncbi:MAG: glycerophosphodiester phosphodiesterase [Acidimicrobiales bacterium]
MSSFPFLDHPGPIPFAHRGGASEAPENTLPAFEHAVGLGFRYLETDVHVTLDGVLVAFHDDHLDRVTDRSGRIDQLSWREVSEARVDGREPIPLLEDVLGTWPEVRVNIDPKADGSVDPLVEVLRRTDAVDRVCVGSFSDERTDRVRAALGPGLCTAMGPDEFVGLIRAYQGEDVEFRSQAAQIPPVGPKGRPLATPELVEVAHRHGIAVHVWTIDDAAEMGELLDIGVDGIMTDRPAVLREVFEARGIWH